MLSHFEFPSDVNKQHSTIKATYIKEFHFSRTAGIAASPREETPLPVTALPRACGLPWFASSTPAETHFLSENWPPNPSHSPPPPLISFRGNTRLRTGPKRHKLFWNSGRSSYRGRGGPSCAFNSCAVLCQGLYVDYHLLNPLATLGGCYYHLLSTPEETDSWVMHLAKVTQHMAFIYAPEADSP